MKSDPSKRIPTTDDTAEMWISWHKSLKKWFSKNEANEHWLRFWNQRGGAGSDADIISLREYMQTQGVDLTTTYMGDLADIGKGITDFVGDSITWSRGLIIGGVVVGIGLIAFYVIYSTTKGKTASDMALEMPIVGKGKGLGQMGVRRKAMRGGSKALKGSSGAVASSVAPMPPIDINSIDFTSGNATNLLT
jgi:hypothetical protein